MQISKDFLLVGFAGRARTGKDTAALYLERNYEFQRYGLADPIKLGARAMFGLTTEHERPENKEEIIPWLGVSPRQLWQWIGTDFGRNMVCDNVWLLIAERALLNAYGLRFRGLVISDVRFENEASWIRSQGGAIIHLERADAPKVNAHVSESGVQVNDRDYVIHNDGSITMLGHAIDAIIEDIKEHV